MRNSGKKVVLKPCDVFFTRGVGIISRMIQVLTRSFGESRTMVNHVGLVFEEGPVDTAVILEARNSVNRGTFSEVYRTRDDLIAVYRPLNLTDEEKNKILSAAETLEGREYSYLKLIAHFLDWCFLGIYLFRRFANDPYYPICSYLVASHFPKQERTLESVQGRQALMTSGIISKPHPQYYSEILSLGKMSSQNQMETPKPEQMISE